MVAAQGGSSGGGSCMLANDGGGASAAPVELLRPQDRVVAETDDTPAEQPCEHFSIRGYVALVQKMDPKYCSLSQIFHGQQQCDERRNSLCPFPVAKFRRWDCSKCSDKAKILDHRTESRTISMRRNGQSDGCSISFVRSTLVPTSVDFKSLFPCTQQLSQVKNADRSTLVKSTPESNLKCNSHSGVDEGNTDSKCNSHSGDVEANTDPPTKGLPESFNNHDTTANISNNAFVDATALPEVSEIRANKEQNRMAVPSSPKPSEVIMKPNAEETDIPKPTSGQKADHVCNSGPGEETTSKRSGRSACKKKNDKPTAEVGASDAKNVRRKQMKVRLLSEIIYTDQAAGSRSDIEVDHENAGGLCEDDRRPDDVVPLSHQTVGETVSTSTKNKTKYKGVDVVDDESSLMNWMKRIPRKSRTEKKDSEHKDFNSSASKDARNGVLSSVGKLNKKRRAPTTSTQQGDENIQDNNLEKNMQSTDDMSEMQSENSTPRSLSKVKNMSLSKRKTLSTVDAPHDDVNPVIHETVGEVLSKTDKNKTKYKGVDVLEEGASLMNWMKRIPKKSRTEKKDSEHKDFDSSAVNSKSTDDRFASKDVHRDFVSSVGKFRKRKMLPTTSTPEGDEHIQNSSLERNMQNTDDITRIQSKNSTHSSLSKVKTISLSKSKFPSTANAQHGDVNTENSAGKRAILRKDDECQIESGSSLQRHLGKVSPGKRGIQTVTSLEQRLHEKRKKQMQEPMHEKQDTIDDIPMDIVELLARNQHERPVITESDSSAFIRTQSKITEDKYCTITAAEDGPTYASTVLSATSQQKPSASESNQKALQNHVASTPQATSTHPLELQFAGHLKSTQEQQTHLCTGEVVTIAASSPLLSQDKDPSIAETPTACYCWSHKGAKLMWDSFQTAPKDSSSTATCGARFRSSIEAVDVTSSHVAGAYHNYPTHQPVVPSVDYYTNRAVNHVQARSFPSTISTIDEAGNLWDRRNAGQSGFYSKEPMPDANLLRLTDSSMLAGFPNYEGSYRNLMEFQLRNSYYAQYRGPASTSHVSNLNGNQYGGSTSTSHGSNLNGNHYGGSTSTSHASNLNGKVPLTLEDLSHVSNLNGKVPLTLEDLSRHRFQQNLHKPLRPHPRVGVLSSLLQKEIANLSDNCATQSGLKIGVSKGVPPLGIHRRENVEALNSGKFSARLTALQLGSGSSGPDYLPGRNNTAQSWTRGREKTTSPLNRFIRQDICVTNRNPSDITVITDDNEYTRTDLI